MWGILSTQTLGVELPDSTYAGGWSGNNGDSDEPRRSEELGDGPGAEPRIFRCRVHPSVVPSTEKLVE
jgi:hypothetical protein